jgi:hypothetical protein
MAENIKGSAVTLILFDISEEIDIDRVRQASGVRQVGGTLKHPAPEYVGFQRPPVVQELREQNLSSGERLRTRIKFYDYGVVSLLFETSFEGDWNRWIELASRWMASGEFERLAYKLGRGQVESPGSAVIKPYSQWLSEDYFVFHIAEVPGSPLSSCKDGTAFLCCNVIAVRQNYGNYEDPLHRLSQAL